MTDVPQALLPRVRRGRWARLAAVAGDRRVRYVVAGGIASLVYYGLFAAGWLLVGRWVPYLLVAVAANVSTAVLTYPMYRRVVFRSSGPWLAGLLRFFVVGLAALMFTLVGLPLLVELAHLHVLVSQAVVIVVVPLVNYQVNKFWTFKDRGVADGRARL